MTQAIKGKTKSGFEYQLDPARLNNYELVEALSGLESSPLMLAKVVKLILGDEQTIELKNHLRLKDGTVPTNKMEAEVTEIFQSQAAIKNS